MKKAWRWQFPKVLIMLTDGCLLVLKMYDRSLSQGGNATVHSIDTEILKLFWSDWLEKSGVKRYQLRPLMTTEAEVAQVVMGFMGIR